MRSRSKAFTLIEAVVAFAIMGLLMGSLTGLMIYALSALRHFLAYNHVQHQMNRATRALVASSVQAQ